MADYNLNGWKRQAPDARDVPHAPRVSLVGLPDWHDLSAGMGPLLDQLDLGACGPFTLDECVTYNQIQQGLAPTGAAPLFTYYTTRFLMGTVDQDSGVDNRTLLKAAAGYGYPPEALYPYDTSKFRQKPPQAVIDAAARNKITSYAAVAKDLATMKATLVAGDPFCFGFDVFDQMMSAECTRTGVLAMPAGSLLGGHDVAVVGYSDVDRPGVLAGNTWPARHFKFRNHWTDRGRPWGDGGYGYVPYEYATGPHADDFWVVNAVPGGVVPPQPKPPLPPSPPPQPEPAVNYVLNASLKTPIGSFPVTGTVTPAVALAGPAELSVPQPLIDLLNKYGPAVGRVLLADLPAVLWFKTKTWADVLRDVMAAVMAG